MNPSTRADLDRMERAGYLPVLRSIAKNSCAPFWWHGIDADGQYRTFHNGTVCFLDTGTRLIAVTAWHVFAKYMKDKKAQPALVCQFGSTTIEPESRLIEQSQDLDLATFDVSTVVVGASGADAHAPIAWPTKAIANDEVLLYGGYPGVLRVERHATADLPFQWFGGPPLSVTPGNIKLHLDLENFHQPLKGAQIENLELGGMSGGPVFRFIPAAPIERIELVGFIYEFQESLELVYARPAHCVRLNGSFDTDAAA